MRTHPDIGLMIASCSKSAADLLQLARFWLCSWRQRCNLLAIRDVTSIANMLTVFAIFNILLYFSHSKSNFEV